MLPASILTIVFERFTSPETRWGRVPHPAASPPTDGRTTRSSWIRIPPAMLAPPLYPPQNRCNTYQRGRVWSFEEIDVHQHDAKGRPFGGYEVGAPL